MKPKELLDYFLVRNDYFEDLFNKIRKELINENRIKEIVKMNDKKEEIAIILVPEEISKTVNEIKGNLGKEEIEEEIVILINLLFGTKVLYKYFSEDEIDYLKIEGQKYKSAIIDKTKDSFNKRYKRHIFSEILSIFVDTLNMILIFK